MGAVVFYLIPVRGDQTDYEWQVIAHCMSMVLVFLKIGWC